MAVTAFYGITLARNFFRQLSRRGVLTTCCRNYCQEKTTAGESSTEQTESGEEREYQVKQRILRSALPFVLKYGWTKEALAEGAVVEGMPGVAHGLFPRGGVELIFYFYRDCNQRLAQQLAEEVKTQEHQEQGASRIRPFIKSAVERRLRMNIPYLEKWPQAMGIQALPQNAPEALSNLLNLTDEIWYHAGDTSTDFNWYTKRVTLGAVIKTTEVFMVQDKSEDFQESWAFLENRMNDLMKTAKLIRKAQETNSVVSEALWGMCIMSQNILGMNSKAR